MLKKIILYSALLLTIWITLSQCFILKNRWSDAKATKVFAQKKVPLQFFDTTINTHRLHYVVSGDNTLPILAIIHGSLGSWMNYMHYMWDTAMQKKFRIVAIDRPGFGYSDFGKAQNLQTQADIILPVLQKLKNNKPFYIMGHSYGGPLVVKLAAMDSTLFTKIILAAAAIDVSQEGKENWRHFMNTKPFFWLLPGAFAPSNTELLYLKKDLLGLQNDFAKVKCKVLFIHGDKDTWVPIKNIAFGTKMMVNASEIIADTIKNADHQIPWKNEERMKKILLGLY